MTTTEPKTRTTIYVATGVARQVKSRLALTGQSLSAWVEEQMREFVANGKKT